MCMVCVMERKCMPRVAVKHLPLVEHAPSESCSIEDCPGPVIARGWCMKHYQRWRRHGDPIALLIRREA